MSARAELPSDRAKTVATAPLSVIQAGIACVPSPGASWIVSLSVIYSPHDRQRAARPSTPTGSGRWRASKRVRYAR
jgi:hypothetical protein